MKNQWWIYSEMIIRQWSSTEIMIQRWISTEMQIQWWISAKSSNWTYINVIRTQRRVVGTWKCFSFFFGIFSNEMIWCPHHFFNILELCHVILLNIYALLITTVFENNVVEVLMLIYLGWSFHLFFEMCSFHDNLVALQYCWFFLFFIYFQKPSLMFGLKDS